MTKTTADWKLYRDDRGFPRKTRSGHFRFDLVIRQEDGTPFACIIGLRLDYDRRRILPVQTQLGGKGGGSTLFTVAEIAPEAHQGLVDAICSVIAETLDLKDESPYKPTKTHRVGCRKFHLFKPEDCDCQKGATGAEKPPARPPTPPSDES